MVRRLYERIAFNGVGHPYNPLMHLFMLMNLIWGVGLTFFSGTVTVQASVIYQLIVNSVGITGVITLGALNLSGLAIMTAAILFRWYDFGKFAAFGGYVSWLYVGILLGSANMWFQVLTYCIPFIAFWGWFFVRMTLLDREKFMESISKD